MRMHLFYTVAMARESSNFARQQKQRQCKTISQLRRLKKTSELLKEYDIIKDRLSIGILEIATENPIGSNKDTHCLWCFSQWKQFSITKWLLTCECISTTTSAKYTYSESSKTCSTTWRYKTSISTNRNRRRRSWCTTSTLVKDLQRMELINIWFARLPFGCISSSFIQNPTLVEHGGGREEEALLIKKKSTKIFTGGGFALCKWHSN